MVFAGVAQVVRIGAWCGGVIPNDQRRQDTAADRVRIAGNAVRANHIVGGALNAIRTSFVQTGELLCRVDLEDIGWRREDVGRADAWRRC